MSPLVMLERSEASVTRSTDHGFFAGGLRMTLAAVMVFGAALFAPALALAQSYSTSSSIDDQALAIANELQCPVCQNVSVAYSNSQLAGQMRQVIREKLQQGETHDQIIQYFVDRYGEGILEQPPKHGLNLLVWLLPLAGLLTGLGILARALWSQRSAAAENRPSPSEAPLAEEDERLLTQALKGLG